MLSTSMDTPELIEEFREVSIEIKNLYENLEFSKATREIMGLADKANQYVDSKQPWVLIKEEGNEKLVQSICTTSINLFRILTILLQPIIPGFSVNALKFLNMNEVSWDLINHPLLDCSINEFKPIVTRVDDGHIENLLGKENG